MLTRLEASGFKNLVDFHLEFGPYTCIAGPNGVGKSNVFDAIRFLALLAEHTINDAARSIRVAPSNDNTGDLSGIFFGHESAAGTAPGQVRRFKLAAEMIVAPEVSDDFGRPAKVTSSFLRYEVGFRYEEPSSDAGPFGGLVLEQEELRPLTVGQAHRHLRFPHSKANFRNRVVYNRRYSGPYIDTEEWNGQKVIVVHQDGGSRGRGQSAPAQGAMRTIVGTENTTATPTILAARQEMLSWRTLALEPMAMRRPDAYTQQPGIGSDGAHIPATLQQAGTATSGTTTEQALAAIASRLSDLVPVTAVRVRRDDVRQLLSLELEERSGLRLPAHSVSDGTLRFLALAALAEGSEESVVFCMEEPENGIHPDNLKAMNLLLHDIAVDPDEPVGEGNPLRQVVVATHSPYLLHLQKRDEFVLARNVKRKSEYGVIEPLVCQPFRGTWRCTDRFQGVDPIALQSYRKPLPAQATAIQTDLWEHDYSASSPAPPLAVSSKRSSICSNRLGSSTSSR